MDWLRAVQQLRHDGQPGVLVTVIEVRGHAPREAGAKMVVSREYSWGSVGGGNLEATAVARARELMSSGAAEPEIRELQLNPHARTEHGRQCCGGVVKLLLEPLAVRPVVALFGVGHVGYELARILSRLPIQLLLVDSRAEQLDRVRLADVIDGAAEVGIYHTLLGEQVLEQLPRGAHVVIMTHDHAEDYALCDAALRLNQPLGGIGLIGSAAKWTRFQAQLAAAGHSPEMIAPYHLPDRPARHHREGPGRDRRRGGGRAAGNPGDPGGDHMTLYAGTIVDTPGDPFTGDPGDALAEVGALLVREGVIRARGSFAALRAEHPDEPVTRLDGGLLVPGFVDTHVHFPQIRAIGGLGMPLLDWLERCALPEESKLADRAYAREVAGEFFDGLIASGTTSALVFGSHFVPAMNELFAAADHRGLNITSGLVLSDRILRPDLLNSPETALTDSADLILRWHDRGRLRYAVTPRFSLSASDEMLDVCAQLLGKGVWFTSHINENVAEIAQVAGLFPGARHYLDTYLPTRPGHGAQRPGPQRAPGRRRARGTGRARRLGLALPDQQLRAGQRAVPATAAHRTRRPGRARLRRGRGRGAVPAQGGAAGLLHPAAAGPGRAPADASAPAVPGDPRRRAGAGPGRPDRRLRGRQGLRCGLAAPARGQHAGGQPQACLRHH